MAASLFYIGNTSEGTLRRRDWNRRVATCHAKVIFTHFHTYAIAEQIKGREQRAPSPGLPANSTHNMSLGKKNACLVKAVTATFWPYGTLSATRRPIIHTCTHIRGQDRPMFPTRVVDSNLILSGAMNDEWRHRIGPSDIKGAPVRRFLPSVFLQLASTSPCGHRLQQPRLLDFDLLDFDYSNFDFNNLDYNLDCWTSTTTTSTTTSTAGLRLRQPQLGQPGLQQPRLLDFDYDNLDTKML
ncbi:hypothetical protein BC832DRAFT_617374 [Gaertneriomyces semiglobifer]|nr:hypothetical protein BC832DRAFT_617374 [Gaertneriomyces semiglobifer]